MTDPTDRLIAEYRDTGRLRGLPAQHFIGGRWAEPVDGGMMETFDPGSARPFHAFAAGGADDVAAAVEAADRARAGQWGATKPAARGAVLARAATIIRDESAWLAVVECLDTGKPLQEAEGDVQGAARCFEYYAGAADKLEGKSLPLGSDYLGYTTWEPVGVTAHIVPWNFPVSTMARGLAPALAAGCTAVVKPAEQTPLSALLLAEILQRAGVPDGVVNVVTGTGPDAGAPLVSHQAVRHVTFTGSVDIGIGVMQAAAANVTSVLLELGGKSPVVVLADADVDSAVEGVLGAIFEHAGQVCSAGSRLVVERPLHRELVARLAERANAMSLGHGLDRPEMGPVSSAAHLEKIASFVDGAKARGVAVAAGAERTRDPRTGEGWFFMPTILDHVPADDPVVQEEIFGPVLCVQVVEDADEAVAVANGTPYGLVAGIYTSDFGKAHRLARDIDAGQVFINEYFAGGIEVPFGGNKMSGFGREKGFDALRSYCKLKSIAARIGGQVP